MAAHCPGHDRSGFEYGALRPGGGLPLPVEVLVLTDACQLLQACPRQRRGRGDGG